MDESDINVVTIPGEVYPSNVEGNSSNGDVVYPSNVDVEDVHADRRRLEGYSSGSKHTSSRTRKTTSRPSAGLDMPALRRRLAKDVEEGVSSARLEDPDIDAKDSDIRLLQV